MLKLFKTGPFSEAGYCIDMERLDEPVQICPMTQNSEWPPILPANLENIWKIYRKCLSLPPLPVRPIKGILWDFPHFFFRPKSSQMGTILEGSVVGGLTPGT